MEILNVSAAVQRISRAVGIFDAASRFGITYYWSNNITNHPVSFQCELTGSQIDDIQKNTQSLAIWLGNLLDYFSIR